MTNDTYYLLLVLAVVVILWLLTVLIDWLSADKCRKAMAKGKATCKQFVNYGESWWS